jgi:hypothetical protein
MCEGSTMSEIAPTTETTDVDTSAIVESPVIKQPAPALVVAGFAIETGIPIPDFQPGRGQGSKYDPLFEALPVGGSIFISGERAEKKVGSLQRAGKKKGVRFTTRKIEEDGVSGIRVWRRESK